MLVPIIPIMTSNDSPSPFVASFSAGGASGTAYQAFDNNDSTSVSGMASTGNLVIQMEFGSTKTVSHYKFRYSYNPSYARSWTTQVLVGGAWTTVHSGTDTDYTLHSYDITPVVCDGIRMLWGLSSSNNRLYVYTLQAYSGPPALPDPIIGEPTAYYVSQQNGNDSNNGLTHNTAWATIEKALMDARANANGNVHVYIGPGNYQADTQLYSNCPGIDSDHRIIYKGDPECLYLVNDSPGQVIIDFYNHRYSECFNFFDRQFVELSNISLNVVRSISVGSYHCAIVGDPLIDNQYVSNVIVQSSNDGCADVDVKNSIVMARNNPFSNCTTYNCVALGSSISGSYAGFNGGISYNCLAALCTLGYLNNVAYNSEAWLCGSVASGGSATNCLASQCYVTSLPTGWVGTMCGQSVASIINTSPLVVQKLNLLNTLRTGLADWGYDLSAVPEAMVDADGVPRHSTLSDIGPWELADHNLEYNNFYLNSPAIKLNGHNQLIFDLPVKKDQEITKSVYVKWFEPDVLDTKLSIAMDSHTTAGHTVDASSVVSGFEPWKAFDVDASTYWSSSGELPEWISYEFPQPEVANKYTIEIPANCQDLTVKAFTFEGWNGLEWVVLDTQTDIVWTSGETKTFTFSNDTAYKRYRLNVSAVQTSILNIYNFEIWGTLSKNNIDDGLKPQLTVSGFGETYTDSCTAVGGLWEKLSITFTPAKSGVIAVKLVARNPVSGSYAIFSDPQ